MTCLQAYVEIIKAVCGLLAGLAWPIAVLLIVWWLRHAIAQFLLTRGFKFEVPFFKLEAEQVKSAFANTEEAIPEAIDQVKADLVAAKSTSSASITPRYIESLSLLIEIANADPKRAIKRSWELLAGAVLRAAKVQGGNVEPNSEDISTSLKQVETSAEYPDKDNLVRSIRNLQEIARKVVYQRQWWSYDPSPKEAEKFIVQSVAARRALGDITARQG